MHPTPDPDAALSAARSNLVEMLLYGTLSLLLGALLAARLGMRIANPLRTLGARAGSSAALTFPTSIPRGR